MTANTSAGLPGTATDGETIAASLREPARFAAVFDRHFGEISTYLARRVDHSLAEELASETFVRAFAARSGYDIAYPDARPWLYGIATNLLRRHARSEERRRRAYARTLERDERSGGLDVVADRVDASAHAPVVADALTRPSPADRDTLLLFALTDLGYEGVALADTCDPARARAALIAAIEAPEAPRVRRQPRRRRRWAPLGASASRPPWPWAWSSRCRCAEGRQTRHRPRPPPYSSARRGRPRHRAAPPAAARRVLVREESLDHPRRAARRAVRPRGRHDR
jgi:DNA-directed RNA polymerase specialized sigma24 family protein